MCTLIKWPERWLRRSQKHLYWQVNEFNKCLCECDHAGHLPFWYIISRLFAVTFMKLSKITLEVQVTIRNRFLGRSQYITKRPHYWEEFTHQVILSSANTLTNERGTRVWLFVGGEFRLRLRSSKRTWTLTMWKSTALHKFRPWSPWEPATGCQTSHCIESTSNMNLNKANMSCFLDYPRHILSRPTSPPLKNERVGGILRQVLSASSKNVTKIVQTPQTR